MFTVTLEWSQPEVHGQLPGARDGHSACVINNVMYIFGGYEDYVSVSFYTVLVCLSTPFM